MICPHCGTPAPDKATHCYRCSASLVSRYPYPAPGYGAPVRDYSPLSYKSYALLIFLSGLPIAGLILLLVWAFGDTPNIHKQNFAKGMLFLACICLGIYLVFMLFALFIGFLGGAYLNA